MFILEKIIRLLYVITLRIALRNMREEKGKGKVQSV